MRERREGICRKNRKREGEGGRRKDKEEKK